MINNFVISVVGAEKRRQHISDEFTHHQIPFEFFDAVTPGSHLKQAIEQFVPKLALQFALSEGEKACFMSHVLLWHKCVEHQMPYIAIYEDDIVLGKDSHFFLANFDWLEPLLASSPYTLIKTETFLDPVSLVNSKLENIKVANCDYRLDILRSRHYGAAAYIISLTTANYLLSLLPKLAVEDLKPIDHILFRNYLYTDELLAYQLNPGICIQEDRYKKEKSVLASQIEKERDNIRDAHKEKLSVFAKIIREIKKLPEAIRKLSYKEVPSQ